MQYVSKDRFLCFGLDKKKENKIDSTTGQDTLDPKLENSLTCVTWSLALISYIKSTIISNVKLIVITIRLNWYEFRFIQRIP